MRNRACWYLNDFLVAQCWEQVSLGLKKNCLHEATLTEDLGLEHNPENVVWGEGASDLETNAFLGISFRRRLFLDEDEADTRTEHGVEATDSNATWKGLRVVQTVEEFLWGGRVVESHGSFGMVSYEGAVQCPRPCEARERKCGWGGSE